MKLFIWFIENFPFSFFSIVQIFLCTYELLWMGRVLFKRERENFDGMVSFTSMLLAVITRKGIIAWVSYYISLTAYMIFSLTQSNNKAYRIIVVFLYLVAWYTFPYK